MAKIGGKLAMAGLQSPNPPLGAASLQMCPNAAGVGMDTAASSVQHLNSENYVQNSVQDQSGDNLRACRREGSYTTR